MCAEAGVGGRRRSPLSRLWGCPSEPGVQCDYVFLNGWFKYSRAEPSSIHETLGSESLLVQRAFLVDGWVFTSFLK